jgi:hypothetical protein
MRRCMKSAVCGQPHFIIVVQAGDQLRPPEVLDDLEHSFASKNTFFVRSVSEGRHTLSFPTNISQVLNTREESRTFASHCLSFGSLLFPARMPACLCWVSPGALVLCCPRLVRQGLRRMRRDRHEWRVSASCDLSVGHSGLTYRAEESLLHSRRMQLRNCLVCTNGI